MSFVDARNESEDLRQELARVDGQRKEVEAAVASLTIDVTTHRATQQRLGETVVRLQNEAAGESFIVQSPFLASFRRIAKMSELISLAAANSLR